MSDNLKHHGCGGWYQPWMTQVNHQGFRCEKCNDELIVSGGDDESYARYRKEQEERWEAYAAAPDLPPPVPLRPASRYEALVLGAYREWSEETYCASFHSPDKSIVREFAEAMNQTKVFYDFEEELLKEWDEWKKERKEANR